MRIARSASPPRPATHAVAGDDPAVISAAPASASEPITSFETVSSTSKAGAHPDFTTSFSLQNPGEPESAKNVSFESPQGIFGNTNATPQCSAVAFALDECGPDSQVGLITIHADYKGNPQLPARHGADL